MTDGERLLDTNVLVHAYTVSDERSMEPRYRLSRRFGSAFRRIGCHGDFQSHVRDRVRELKNRTAGKKTGTGWFPGVAGGVGDER